MKTTTMTMATDEIMALFSFLLSSSFFRTTEALYSFALNFSAKASSSCRLASSFPSLSTYSYSTQIFHPSAYSLANSSPQVTVVLGHYPKISLLTFSFFSSSVDMLSSRWSTTTAASEGRRSTTRLRGLFSLLLFPWLLMAMVLGVFDAFVMDTAMVISMVRSSGEPLKGKTRRSLLGVECYLERLSIPDAVPVQSAKLIISDVEKSHLKGMAKNLFTLPSSSSTVGSQMKKKKKEIPDKKSSFSSKSNKSTISSGRLLVAFSSAKWAGQLRVPRGQLRVPSISTFESSSLSSGDDVVYENVRTVKSVEVVDELGVAIITFDANVLTHPLGVNAVEVVLRVLWEDPQVFALQNDAILSPIGHVEESTEFPSASRPSRQWKHLLTGYALFASLGSDHPLITSSRCGGNGERGERATAAAGVATGGSEGVKYFCSKSLITEKGSNLAVQKDKSTNNRQFTLPLSPFLRRARDLTLPNDKHFHYSQQNLKLIGIQQAWEILREATEKSSCGNFSVPPLSSAPALWGSQFLATKEEKRPFVQPKRKEKGSDMNTKTFKTSYAAALPLSMTAAGQSLRVKIGLVQCEGGINFEHPDLQGSFWTNPKEIANNGKDDDGENLKEEEEDLEE